MATTNAPADTQKITVTIPIALLNRLDDRIPKRQRSEFITEAIEEYLALAEQIAAIEESAGVWTEENHPDMRTEEDIDRWLAAVRANWTKLDAE
jgi:metal-responsive CopG/Arc/MetJ family transcriptional regulator